MFAWRSRVALCRQGGSIVKMRSGVLAAFAFAAASALLAEAATLGGGAVQPGPPIHQRFIGKGASVVRSPAGAACMVSAALDIEGARYLARGDRAPVDFSEVIRSYAASVQFIAAAPQMAETVRIQLKYAVADGGAPTLEIDGQTYDLSAALETSGDSLLLDDPAVVAALRAAIDSGASASVAAVSRDTGRLVIDAMPAIDFTSYDVCRVIGPATEGARAPELTNQIAVEYIAEPEAAMLATPIQARACGVTDPSVALYRGRLVQTTGFVSQTEDIFVAFDPDGTVRHAYIPGIFDAALRGDGAYDGGVSIAANSNDVLTANAVTGCLGAAPVAICDQSGLIGSGADGARALGQCYGDLLAGDPFKDPQFLSDFALDEPGAITTPPAKAGDAISQATAYSGGGFPGGFPSGFFGGGGGGGGGSGGGGSGGGGGGSGGGGSTPPTVVPLPAAALFLLSSVALLALTRRRTRV